MNTLLSRLVSYISQFVWVEHIDRLLASLAWEGLVDFGNGIRCPDGNGGILRKNFSLINFFSAFVYMYFSMPSFILYFN